LIIKEEKAIEHFNKEAIGIFCLLAPYNKRVGKRRYPRSLKHQIIPHIPLEEAENIIESQINSEGGEISRFFYDKSGQRIGLDVLNYKRFEKLIDQLYKRKNINNMSSRKALITLTFDWLKKRYCKKIDEDETFVQFFESQIKSIVKKFKISIPIRLLDIDCTFRVGNVEFEYFTEELFDKIEKKLEESVKQNNLTLEGAKKSIKKIRKDYQGKVFASVVISAEQNKATEIAENDIEEALLALKFFSPAAFFPKLTAYFGRKGSINLPESYLFIFENEIPIIREAVKDNIRIGLAIDHLTLQNMYQSGLSILSEIIKKKNPTEFEELIRNSVFTFSKALANRDFHEKMIFVLSSAEIAFLKNYTEPIQHNLAYRLGFFIFKDADDRKKVVGIIKNSYEIRSKFLHHGYNKQDYSLLSELLYIVRKAINEMIFKSSDFSNKEEFIEYIENIIYS